LTEVSKNIKGLTEKDYEYLGCIRFSHYCEFGFEKELEQICKQFKRFYDLNFNENKAKVVDAFKQRDFEKINDLICKNEMLKSNYFLHASDLTLTYLNIVNNISDPSKLGYIFARQFSQVV